MRLPCPQPDCDADVELDAEEVSNGDGVWFQTYLAFYVVGATIDNHEPCCDAGCVLTGAQVEALEAQAAHDYATADPY